MGTALVPYVEEQVVRVGLLYNPFDPTTFEKHELVYTPGATIADYTYGLPETCDWRIALNGQPVKQEDYAEVVPAPNDVISVVHVPRGGNSKDILRMVALVALVAVAAVMLGPGALGIAGLGLTGTAYAAAFAVTVAVGGFLINMAIPPTAPKLNKQDEGQSYGYDGAKNTAREGITLPVVYGAFNVAGNYVDLFTQNVNDDQYMYGRLVLSDGEIDGMTGTPKLNDQPITDYHGVAWGVTYGKDTDPVNPKFNRAIAQYTRQAKLDSNWVQYDTVDEIDAFQLNFVMPMGLIEYNDDGSRSPEDSVIEIQYTSYGTTNWTAPGVPTSGGSQHGGDGPAHSDDDDGPGVSFPPSGGTGAGGAGWVNSHPSLP